MTTNNFNEMAHSDYDANVWNETFSRSGRIVYKKSSVPSSSWQAIEIITVNTGNDNFDEM